MTSEAEVGDIKKARILLQSVTTTNPKHGPGWIAAARVEEVASKLAQARKIILQGLVIKQNDNLNRESFQYQIIIFVAIFQL